MTEDFPQDPVQAEGDWQQQPQPALSIPIIEETGAPATIAASENDVPTSNNVNLENNTNESDGRIHDVAKAWDMAHAGKADHDKALWQKKQAQESQEGLDRVPAIVGDAIAFHTSVANLINTARQINPNQDYHSLDAASRERLDEIDRSLATKFKDAIKDMSVTDRSVFTFMVNELKDRGFYGAEDLERATRSGFEDSRDMHLQNSQHYEQRASEKEWTVVLHDNYPSAAYLERYGFDKPITVHMLAELENELRAPLFGNRNKETLDRWDVTVRLQRTFLEDIRSGRAAQWQ